MSDAELEHGEGEAVPQAQADEAGGAIPKRKPLGNISPPKPFQMVGSADTIAENWKLWKTTWNIYEIVAQLSDFDVEYQVAVLLHTLGPEAMKVYSTMEFLSDENRDVKTILSKFDTFTIGEANETYERYIFNNRVQSETESFDEYLTAIRTLSQTCNFCNCLKDSLLRDRIVTGIRDAQTRKRLLQDSKLTLNTCIAVCRGAEATSARLKTMHTEDVHKVGKHKSKQGNKPVHVNREKKKPQEQKTQKCKFCAYSHVMDRRKCPAWGKTCSLCGEENHFKKCCKRQKRPVHTVDTDESEDSDSLEFISTVCVDHDTVELCNKVGKNKSSDIFAKMLLVDQDTTVDFQLDCGASVNILPRNCVKSKIEITPTQKVLRMWNGTLVHPDGVTRLIVRNPKNKKRYSVEFVVVSNAGCSLVPLLGAKAVQQMGLLTVNRDNFVPVNSVSRGDTVVNAEVKDDSSANAMRIINSYAENFGEIGTLPGKVHLYVKEDAQPVVSNQNRVPVSQREALKKELDRLVSQEVIAPVDVPTDWVSTLVIAQKKSGGMRICMDPKHLNEVLKREHYQLPTIEEILPDLSDAKVFSSCDLSHGFWHLELDHESSMLCTFATPFGRFRWKRLAFGLSVSPEIFQKRLHQALEGLPGVKCIVDDIIVYGRGDDKSVAQVDHDKNLEGLMQRCKSLGIKLNRGKLQLCRPEVSFLGHLLTEQGLKADPEKIKAVVDMPRPENVEDIQRFAGFVNYLARFLPHLSEVLQPLRKLTHGDVKWEWGDQEEKAFEEVKKLVTSAPVLAYYKESEELILQTDASSTGLGAVLMQNGRPIAFASRALLPAESRYAQIEKEMLSVVFGLQKFYTYTYGRKVIVENDHKPLEAITSKPLHCAPKRLQNMILAMQQFDAKIKYRKGTEVILADTLSRAYLPNTQTDGVAEEFEKVNMAKFLPITDYRLEQIKEETERDETLQKLKQTVLNGWPDSRDSLPVELYPYFNCRDEISVQNGLIFRGERVVIPRNLRSLMKTRIHTSHIGIEGCLRRARECLYWPKMSDDIKEYISTCESCCKYQADQTKETLQPTEMPERPWQKVGCDLFTLDNCDYLITVDYYSNFWEIDRLYDTKSSTVVKKLKAHFARYGLPDQLVSDGGPQFVSDVFHKFVTDWDIEHLTSSPYNSKGNGKAESAVKTAKRLLRKAKDSGSDQYMALLDYRNTPTQGVGSSPVQRLMNRRTKTLLPTTESLLKPRSVDTDAERSKLKSRQKKQKSYFDKTAKDLKPLNEGDVVRMKPFKMSNKVWRKATVLRRLDDRSYEVETDNGIVRRNRLHIRKSNEKSNVKDNIPAESYTPRKASSTSDVRKSPKSSEVPKRSADVPMTPRTLPVPDPICASPMLKTRSGRTVKPPGHLKDFVT